MENENEKQIQVIEAVKSYNPEFIRNCYAVGLWVWAEFKQRLNQQELSFLKEAGFRWNPRRKVWQNACGVKKRQSAGDPRSKYGVVRISED
jgi:hypothetical protein